MLLIVLLLGSANLHVQVMRQDINESDEDALEIELSTSEDSSDATGGPSQRRLRGVLHSGGTKTPFSEGNDEIRRRLDEVVEAGIAAARAEDPELDAKDRDIELLSVRFQCPDPGPQREIPMSSYVHLKDLRWQT